MLFCYIFAICNKTIGLKFVLSFLFKKISLFVQKTKHWFVVALILVFWSHTITAQNDACSYAISGRVLDKNNKEAIPYVTVKVSNSEKYAISDANGYFKINGLCSENNTLIVSCLGYCNTETEHHQHEHGNTCHIFIAQKVSDLEGVLIRTEKKEKIGIETIAQEKISKSEIRSSPTNSLAAVLSKQQGVTFTSLGANVQLPVIHGLSGNRILLLNNGLKHGFQNWGADHAPEIDINSAHSITTIKGAGGVRFGPEALGGAIVIESNPLKFNDPFYVNLGTGIESNGAGLNANLEIGQGLKKWSYFVNGNYTKIGDRRAPNYNLTNTGKEEKSFSLGSLYHHKKWDFKAYYSYVDQNLAVLRSSFVTSTNAIIRAFNANRPLIVDPFSYEIKAPNQRSEHHLAKAEIKWWYSDEAKLTFIAGHQLNKRKEFDVRRNVEKPIINLDLNTTDYQLEWKHPTFLSLNGLMGIQYFSQDNDNNPGTNTTAFIPNYNINRFSLFFIERIKLNNNTLEAGVRFDHENNDIRGRETNQDIFRDNYQFNNVTASLGLKTKFSKNVSFRSNIGTAWRTPNVAELFSFGQNGFALRYGLLRFNTNDQGVFSTAEVTTLKNSDVKAEVGYKLTNEFKIARGKDAHLFTFYANYIENYVFDRPLGVLGSIRGATPAFFFDQADSAFIGIDYTWKKEWTEKFLGTLGFSYLWSKNVSQNEPLINQPPITLNYQLDWRHKKLWKFDSSTIQIKPSYTFKQFNAPRTIPIENLVDGSVPLRPGDEIFDFKDAPEGYFLLDLSWSIKRKRLSASLTVNNLLNTSYRSNLNQLRYFADELGTNVFLNLNYSIQ